MENRNILLADHIKKVSKVIKANKENEDLKMKIKTYGCQMNEHDSEKISWVLQNIGYREVLDDENANFIIFNTCAVRESAEDKVLGQLGQMKHLKRKNPNLILAVCGCMTQREEMANLLLEKYKHVDIIFGTNNIQKLPQLIQRHIESEKTIVDIEEEHREVDESVEANRLYDFKAFVNIMYGCNNFCSYCIVPYTRGREISREPKYIINEIEELVKSGTKEITLLGQNVNSYGKTLDVNYNFTNLLYDINEIKGLKRLRFMTSHPKDISDDLIKSYGKLDKLSNHLHLPVQSGSNRILQMMNRKYTRESYLNKVKKIRSINPNITLTTDIIVGFPGETDKDFEDTLNLVREVKYDSAFTFLYSIRKGTPAAKSSDQVSDELKHQRFQKLLDVLNPISLEKNQKYLGRTLKVLVDGLSKNNENILTGRTDCNKLVNFPGNKDLIGSIVDVKITDAKTFTLDGKLVDY